MEAGGYVIRFVDTLENRITDRLIMNGQWIGRYTGTNSGQLVVDLDDMGTHYEGVACAYDDEPSLPGTFVIVKTTNREPTFQGRLPLEPIDPRTGQPNSWANVRTLFPEGINMPSIAEVALNLDDDVLKVEWRTDVETSGSAALPRTKAGKPTEYQPLTEVQS
jgi:hypothetical protein